MPRRSSVRLRYACTTLIATLGVFCQGCGSSGRAARDGAAGSGFADDSGSGGQSGSGGDSGSADGGDATMVCTPGTRTCEASQPMLCNPSGRWQLGGVACGTGYRCLPATGACELCGPLPCDDSQGPIVWQRILTAGQIQDLVIDGAGRIFTCGQRYLPGSVFIDHLGAYDKDGQLLWEKENQGFGIWMRLLVDGAGDIWGVTNQGYVARYSPEGEQLALVQIRPGDKLQGLAIDASGNLYVAGTTDIGGTNGEHAFVARFDPDMNQIWLNTDSAMSAGETVLVDANGNVYFSGRVIRGTPSLVDGSDLLLAQYTTDGTFVSRTTDSCWDYIGEYVNVEALLLDPPGGLIVGAAWCSVSTSMIGRWTTAPYAKDWQQTFPGENSPMLYDLKRLDTGVIVTVAGNLNVTGYSATGSLLWNESYGTPSMSMTGFDLASDTEVVSGGQWYSDGTLEGRYRILVKLRLPQVP